SLYLAFTISAVAASVMAPLVTGSTGPADRPGRIGLQERPGRAEANHHLSDALRRILGLIVVRIFLVTGHLMRFAVPLTAIVGPLTIPPAPFVSGRYRRLVQSSR